MAGGEHGPTVGAALCDKEGFSGFEQVENWQIISMLTDKYDY